MTTEVQKPSEAEATSSSAKFFGKEGGKPLVYDVYYPHEIPWDEFAKASGGSESLQIGNDVLIIRWPKYHAFLFLDKTGQVESILGQVERAENGEEPFKVNGAAVLIGEDSSVLIRPAKEDYQATNTGCRKVLTFSGIEISKERGIKHFEKTVGESSVFRDKYEVFETIALNLR